MTTNAGAAAATAAAAGTTAGATAANAGNTAAALFRLLRRLGLLHLGPPERNILSVLSACPRSAQEALKFFVDPTLYCVWLHPGGAVVDTRSRARGGECTEFHNACSQA